MHKYIFLAEIFLREEIRTHSLKGLIMYFQFLYGGINHFLESREEEHETQLCEGQQKATLNL